MEPPRRRQALLIGLWLASCAHRETPPPPRNADPPPSTPRVRVAPARSQDPMLTTDGAWLFFATQAFGPSYDLYRKRPDGETATVVIASPGDERFPALAPDGRRLAFCSTVENFVAIYLFEDFARPPPIAEWPRHRISPDNVHALHPTWSPDGTRIAYSAAAGGDWSRAGLAIYEPASRATHQLGVTGLFPNWSPKGDRIVFQKLTRRDAFLSGLWVVDVDGVEVREETRIFDRPGLASITPAWSPDGSRVVFAITRPVDGDPIQQARDLGIVTADGAQFWQITEDAEPDWLPLWPAEDLLYFVSERDGAPSIYTMKPGAAARP